MRTNIKYKNILLYIIILLYISNFISKKVFASEVNLQITPGIIKIENIENNARANIYIQNNSKDDLIYLKYNILPISIESDGKISFLQKNIDPYSVKLLYRNKEFRSLSVPPNEKIRIDVQINNINLSKNTSKNNNFAILFSNFDDTKNNLSEDSLRASINLEVETPVLIFASNSKSAPELISPRLEYNLSLFPNLSLQPELVIANSNSADYLARISTKYRINLLNKGSMTSYRYIKGKSTRKVFLDLPEELKYKDTFIFLQESNINNNTLKSVHISVSYTSIFILILTVLLTKKLINTTNRHN